MIISHLILQIEDTVLFVILGIEPLMVLWYVSLLEVLFCPKCQHYCSNTT